MHFFISYPAVHPNCFKWLSCLQAGSSRPALAGQRAYRDHHDFLVFLKPIFIRELANCHLPVNSRILIHNLKCSFIADWSSNSLCYWCILVPCLESIREMQLLHHTFTNFSLRFKDLSGDLNKEYRWSECPQMSQCIGFRHSRRRSEHRISIWTCKQVLWFEWWSLRC